MSEVEERRELLSTKGIKLSTLKDLSTSIQDECADYSISKVSSETLRMNELAGITYLSDGGEIRRVGISQYALGQLCNKIGVPARYIDKCIQTGRLDLAQDNITSWVSDYNNSMFVREYKDTIRGVLSSRFTTLDTPDIIDTVQDIFPDYSVKGFFLNEERFHVRLIKRSKLVIPYSYADDDLFEGVTIDSSDIGRSALNVNFLLYKQVCTNGLCLPKGKGEIFRQKHIGITKEAFMQGLRDNLELVPEIAKEVAVRIADARGVGGVDFDSEKSVKSAIELVKAKTFLTEEQASKVVSLFEYRVNNATDFTYENNNWGLVNAVTEFSQGLTLERRLDLEKDAGALLFA